MYSNNDMDWDYYEYGQQEIEEQERMSGIAKFNKLCVYKSQSIKDEQFNHFKIAPKMEDLQSQLHQFGKDCIITKQAGNLKIVDKTETPIKEDISKAEVPKQRISKLLNTTSDARIKTGSVVSIYPNTAIGLVLATFKNGIVQRGTGALCGPNHVITDGNVLEREDKCQLTKVEFYPGAMGTYSIYSKVEVVRAIVFEQKDLGLLILDKPLGLHSGWFGLASLNDASLKSQKVSITGYPQDRDEGNYVYQYSSTGKIDQVEKDNIQYQLEATSGQNGSPIYVEKIITETYIEHYLIGLHLGRNKAGNCNYGARISQENIEKITDAMEYFILTESLEESFYDKLMENQREFTAEFDECNTTTKNASDVFYAIRNHLDLREVNIRIKNKNNQPTLSDQSLKDLSQSLKNMRHLQHLKLDLFNCDNLTNESLTLLGTGLNYLKDLEYLSITLNGNKKFNQNGFRDFTSHLQSLGNLQTFNLQLHNLQTLNDEILGFMGTHIARIPRVLTLKIDCQMLKNVGEKGIKNLTKAIEPIKRLEKINFIFMGINVPASFKQEIKGKFKWCKGFSLL